METTIDDNIRFLEQAKSALSSLEQIRSQKIDLAANEKRIEKLIAAEQRSIEDEINRTVKKRRDEVVSGYDKEIVGVQERLKKLRSKKEQARNAGMKERIKEETADLASRNSDLKTHIHTIVKQNGLPAFCESGWFYVFFLTSTALQWVILAAACVVWMFVIPYMIYIFSGSEAPLLLTLLHLIFFAVTMTGYFLINVKVKYRYYDTLKLIQADRAQIARNKKEIRLITKDIKKDDDDERYDLGDFNYEIAKTEAEVEDVAQRKKEALSTFEAVTRQVICDEITETGRERLNELRAEQAANASALAQTEETYKNSSIRFTDRYGGYLPRECMDQSNIDQLIELMRSGQASSITEAVTVFQTKKA